jgi:hypothetical protein
MEPPADFRCGEALGDQFQGFSFAIAEDRPVVHLAKPYLPGEARMQLWSEHRHASRHRRDGLAELPGVCVRREKAGGAFGDRRVHEPGGRLCGDDDHPSAESVAPDRAQDLLPGERAERAVDDRDLRSHRPDRIKRLATVLRLGD